MKVVLDWIDDDDHGGPIVCNVGAGRVGLGFDSGRFILGTFLNGSGLGALV